MAYCNRLVTGTSSRSIYNFKNVIRILTTFSKKKKKSLNVIAKTYLQVFNFEIYFSGRLSS